MMIGPNAVALAHGMWSWAATLGVVKLIDKVVKPEENKVSFWRHPITWTRNKLNHGVRTGGSYLLVKAIADGSDASSSLAKVWDTLGEPVKALAAPLLDTGLEFLRRNGITIMVTGNAKPIGLVTCDAMLQCNFIERGMGLCSPEMKCTVLSQNVGVLTRIAQGFGSVLGSMGYYGLPFLRTLNNLPGEIIKNASDKSGVHSVVWFCGMIFLGGFSIYGINRWWNARNTIINVNQPAGGAGMQVIQQNNADVHVPPAPLDLHLPAFLPSRNLAARSQHPSAPALDAPPEAAPAAHPAAIHPAL